MSVEKIKRNKEIIKKRKRGWSFGEIANFYGLDRKTVFVICRRDAEKYVGSYQQKKV